MPWISKKFSFKCSCERRINGKGSVRGGKGFTLLILNEDIDDVIKIVKSLEDSGGINWWSYWSSKTWNKKSRRWVSCCFVSTFGCLGDKTCDFFRNRKYYWKKGHESDKSVRDILITWIRIFSSALSFKQYRDYYVFHLRNYI